MSGWIKIEKDLRDDPRFLRMVRNYVTQVRISERHAATLLVGCLAQLWMYADSHIREDDTLDLGTDEIDQLIGIEGFAKLMPTDWLEIVDANSVKLPGFQAHNGTEAKKKALTQKRVARHRIRNVTQSRSEDDDGCNASALPDQTRLDQTRPSVRGARTPPPEAPSQTEGYVWSQVEAIKATYPKAARADWITAEKLARQLVVDGRATWQQLKDGVTRYAKLVQATNRMVLNPARFFGDVDQPWQQEWPLPAKTVAGVAVDPEAEQAWRDVLAEKPRTPRMHAAVEAAGGWQRIRARTAFDEAKIRAEFLRGYQEAAA